jgi:hypothetical protein
VAIGVFYCHVDWELAQGNHMRQAIKTIIQQRSTATWLATGAALEKLAAGGMKMSLPTLIKLIRTKEIEGKQVGARYFVSRESIDALLKSN